MAKTLVALAAGAALFVFALPGPASADERRADGVRNSVEQMEFSSRHRRWHRRHFVRRHYYRPYYAAPYYGYGYGYPYGYYRPRPFVGLGFGPFGFGVW
jgi:hypothetical protein